MNKRQADALAVHIRNELTGRQIPAVVRAGRWEREWMTTVWIGTPTQIDHGCYLRLAYSDPDDWESRLWQLP